MHLNIHHIIKFAMKRFKLTKKAIAEDYLNCSPPELSRPKPPDIDPEDYYRRLFDVKNKTSAALGEDESDLLGALYDFIKKIGCEEEAKYIATKREQRARYEEIVIEVLKRANAQLSDVKASKDKPTSLCHIPTNKTKLFGRGTELEKIADIYDESNYAVLTGIGGIGKSYIATTYAHRLNKTGEHTIQHIICEDDDNLRKAMCRLQFDNLVADDFECRLKALKEWKQPTLIIFDNLNKSFNADDHNDFKKLRECGQHIKFLITSRVNLLSYGDKEHTIKVDPLDSITLLRLYTYHRFSDSDNHTEYIERNKKVLREIFKNVHNHTLMIELLAKLAQRSGMKEPEINQKLKDGLDISPKTVSIIKDDNVVIDKVNKIIRTIFSISHLDETQKDILAHLSLVPLSGHYLASLEMLLRLDSDREILLLRDNGWIMMDEETKKISMHPLIREMFYDMGMTPLCGETLFLERILQILRAAILDGFPDVGADINEVRRWFGAFISIIMQSVVALSNYSGNDKISQERVCGLLHLKTCHEELFTKEHCTDELFAEEIERLEQYIKLLDKISLPYELEEKSYSEFLDNISQNDLLRNRVLKHLNANKETIKEELQEVYERTYKKSNEAYKEIGKEILDDLIINKEAYEGLDKEMYESTYSILQELVCDEISPSTIYDEMDAQEKISLMVVFGKMMGLVTSFKQCISDKILKWFRIDNNDDPAVLTGKIKCIIAYTSVFWFLNEVFNLEEMEETE